MSAKAPYYYSELRGKEGVPSDEPPNTEPDQPDQEQPSPSAEPLREDSGSGLQGFYNPLLSIEPDISTEEFRPRKSSPKKKKKKKKKIYSSPFKQSNLSMQNGASSSKADAKSISLRCKMPSPENAYACHSDQRRNSEPNLYEEIPDNIPKEEPTYSTGSLAGFFLSQRRRPSSSQYASSGRLSETVLSEVNEVQQKHALILENLNLDFETMLMPECSSSSTSSVPIVHSPARHLSKLLLGKKQPSVVPPKAGTAECLMAQYEHSKIYAQQRRGNEYILSQSDLWNLNASTPSKSIYCQHRYPKGVLSASESLGSLRRSSEPLYMLYDDSHRLQRLCCREIDDNIYEEVDHLREQYPGTQNGGTPHPGASCSSAGGEDRLSWGSSSSGNPYALENNLGHSEGSDEDGENGASGLASRFIGKSKKKPKKKDTETGITSGFTRWFSTRRKEYELEKINKMNIKPLPEDGYVDVKLSKKQRPPLSLPPVRPGLSNEQMRRRYIVQNIVDSENSYVNSLQRLIKDYKRPLEESQPPVVSSAKISTMFYRLEQILQCHNMFGIALTQCVRDWDFSEKIGDVFVASFSKVVVLDIYSDFINNFSTAMETAKLASKNKSAFADFLKVKQITSPDRLSFFGLMVKPVQRFPQFILLLQDLLKNTARGHHDRISLQLALTQLELLADTLNERKRESEQSHSVKEVLKHLGNKFSLRGILAEGTPGPAHFLLRQDNVIQLDMDQTGMVVKSKNRRLYLLNDLLVCMSVSPRSSENMSSGERFSLKWAVPLQEVEVQEDVAPATRNLLASSGRYKNVVNRNSDRNTESSFAVQALYDDLSDLIHDLEVMSRIAALISSLRRTYTGLNVEMLGGFSQGIQEAIRKKDEEITLLDSCCLQLILPAKSNPAAKPGYNKEVLCFQLMSPGIKLDWITDLRLAKLAMDANNTPAWDIKEQDKRPSFRMPLFEKTLPAFTGTPDTEVEVNCGCFYAVCPADGTNQSNKHYLCLSTADGVNSHIHVMQVGRQGSQVRKLGTFSVTETRILSMEAVPSYYSETGLASDIASDPSLIVPGVGETLWVGTDSRRIVVVNGRQPEEWQEVGALTVAAPVQHIKYHCQHVFSALSNGTVLIFTRGEDCVWKIQTPQIVTLGTDPVTCLLPLGQALYCACSSKIWVIHAPTQEVQRSYVLQQCTEGAEVNLLAHSGTGLWISLRNSPTICLYHTETFHHLQDINVAPCVQRLLSVHYPEEQLPEDTQVTSLMATRGLLWVGTNLGVVVTIPLPRLEGVPILSGRSNVAYHAHTGPVSLLLSLQARTLPILQPPQAPLPLAEEMAAVEETSESSAQQTEDIPSERMVEEEVEEEGLEEEREDSLEGMVQAKPAAPLLEVVPAAEVIQPRVLKPQKSDSLLPSGWLGRKLMGVPPRHGLSDIHSSGAKTLPRKMMLCRQPLSCHQQPSFPHGNSSATTPHPQRQPSMLAEDANNVYGLYADLMNVQDYEKDSQEKLYERLNHSDPELVHFKLNTLDRRLQQKMGRPRSWDLSTMAVSEDSDSSAAYDTSSIATVPCSEAQPSPLVQPHNIHHHPSEPPGAQVGVGGAPKNPRVLPRCMHPKHKVDPTQKTLIVLTGGSGYINWRMVDKDPAKGKQDAQVILWEMKL